MASVLPRRVRGLPLWQPLRERDFRLFWLGQTVSLLGDQCHFIALAWLTLQLTGSGLALGTVLMTAAIPRGVLMLVGGAISDRFAARGVMFASNLLRGAIVALISADVMLHTVALWHLYLLAGVFGLLDAFSLPAIGMMTPLLLKEDGLQAGNALMQGSMQGSTFIGPAVAGILVAVGGAATAFSLDAASFLFASLTLWLMSGAITISRAPERVGAGAGTDAAPNAATSAATGAATGHEASPGLLATIRAGLAYAWGDPVLRVILIIIAAINAAFEGPIVVGLAALAERRFLGGSALYGLMLSGWGAGSLLGIALAGSVGRPRRLGVLLLGVTAALGVGIALVGVAPSAAAVVAVLAAMGTGSGFLNVFGFSWLQSRAEPAMLGRVMSLVMLASVGTGPISYALAGFVVDRSLTLTLVGAGALLVTTALISATSRTVRALG